MGESTNSRPALTASGTLAKTPLVHLLAYALEKKLSGTIELFSPDKKNAVILFAGGEPLKVRTSEAVAYLGQVLHDLGHVDEQELSRSLAELAKRKAAGPMLHGALLLEWGTIDLAKLRAGLAEQVGRKLQHVAGMPGETAYAYYDEFDVLRGWGGDDATPVDPVPYMWGMIREHTSWDHVDATLARVGRAAVRLSDGAVVSRLRLSKDDEAAVQNLRRRPLRPADLAKAANLSDRDARLLAYLLLVTKQVDVFTVAEEGGATVSAEPRVSTPPAAARASMPSQHASAAKASVPPPPPGLTAELSQRWKEIVDRAATIDRADYFMMLDVARDATQSDVESAFFALAKRWHPDRLPPEPAT
jgi:hypothetical protein